VLPLAKLPLLPVIIWCYNRDVKPGFVQLEKVDRRTIFVVNNSTEIANIDWSADRMLPAFQAPHHLNVYDIRSISRDEQLSVTTLAGLINRPQPQVYLIANDDDSFWLNEVLASIPHDTPYVASDAILDALLTTYRTSVRGMVIYDPNFIDSINIATTLAGQRDAIVVSPTQAQTLEQGPHKLPILDDLRNYQWHTRLHAYHWAKLNLLNNASTHVIAGLDPNNLTGLRSFLVATRTFVYWLDSRNYITDPTLNWMSERRLMKQLYSTLPAGATHLGWFINEPSGVALTSESAMAVLATDFFSNLEVWTSVRASVPITQNVGYLPPRQGALPGGQVSRFIVDQQPTTSASKVYVSFTISDGDNLQYSQHRMLRLWRDAARGSIPIGWTISPVLPQAAPAMAAYYTRTATPNDELIAGPSGAGYMFPSRWPAEHLPAFLQRTGQLMQNWQLMHLEILDTNFLQRVGLSIIAFLGRKGMTFFDENLQQHFAQTLRLFGVRGLLSGAGLSKPAWAFSAEQVPVYHNLGLAYSIKKTVSLIKDAASAREERPLFLNVYILAWKMTPSDLKQVVEQLGNDYEIVTPGTLLAMIARSQLRERS